MGGDTNIVVIDGRWMRRTLPPHVLASVERLLVSIRTEFGVRSAP